MSIAFTQAKDFNKAFFGWFTGQGYSISNTKDLERVFYEDYTCLPASITQPYQHSFEFEAEDFNFTDFGGSEYHKEKGTPIGLRHIQVFRDGPRFEFLCGWMGGGYYLDVLVIFYLNEKGIPSLYIPIMGNPVSASRKVYEADQVYDNFLDEDGDYVHDFNKIREELLVSFGFKSPTY